MGRAAGIGITRSPAGAEPSARTCPDPAGGFLAVSAVLAVSAAPAGAPVAASGPAAADARCVFRTRSAAMSPRTAAFSAPAARSGGGAFFLAHGISPGPKLTSGASSPAWWACWAAEGPTGSCGMASACLGQYRRKSPPGPNEHNGGLDILSLPFPARHPSLHSGTTPRVPRSSRPGPGGHAESWFVTSQGPASQRRLQPSVGTTARRIRDLFGEVYPNIVRTSRAASVFFRVLRDFSTVGPRWGTRAGSTRIPERRPGRADVRRSTTYSAAGGAKTLSMA
jgi:hypothetical protein